MENLGFKNTGGVWSFPDSDIIIEFPKGPLDGVYEKTTKVNVENGTLLIIGIEDIIIDRSARKQYWGDADEWAKYMIMAHHADLDWDYLKQRAQEASCLETLLELKKRYKKGLGDISEQNPKRRILNESVEYQEYIDKIRLAPIIKIENKTSPEERFIAYAKKIITKGKDWTAQDDLLIIKSMAKDRVNQYKIKKV